MSFQSIARRAILPAVLAACAFPAAAATLRVTVTNNFAAGGFSLTPLWVAFQDGSFDAFDRGSAASGAVESLAELGDPSGLDAALAAADGDAVSGVIPATATGPGTIDPGETGSAEFEVSPASARYFTFMSMLVPSNDSFLGAEDPLAHELFDASGGFLGDLVLTLTAADLFDAGTEVNNAENGPAFVIGQDGTAGEDENGVVGPVSSLSGFAGIETPLGDLILPDLTGDPAGLAVATIRIEQIPEVPVPPAAALAVSALAALGMLRRRRA
ncbi:spondin domain-containing protein [Mangrovicoccus ximenensis]|uniref:spondin domain-containing protein n=1 Tax=Mangrovicoccus ximenensis TaxID=1911570 RepID=UPI000D37B432|nr:spondin domain-containing protein [Mangrovicoccus ximenensis]